MRRSLREGYGIMLRNIIGGGIIYQAGGIVGGEIKRVAISSYNRAKMSSIEALAT